MKYHQLDLNLKQSLRISFRPHAPFYCSPLDLVLVSCSANLPFVPNNKHQFELLFWRFQQASEGESEASKERETPLSCRVCLSLLHVRFERRSPEKQKKHSACSAGYTI